MIIIGISAYYHDSAACLIVNGEIIAAAQEERFTRKKHDANFPINAITYCLKEGRLKIGDINYVVFYDKPFIKFERLLETYLAYAPRGFKSFLTSLPLWVKDKIFQKNIIINELKALSNKNINWEERLLFSEHHFSHAASAFFPSPFKNAAVLTMDGVGEWATTSLAIGSCNKLQIQKEINFPHSLGLLYSAFTYYTGFKVNSGEYKMMGLAPYGQPRYAQLIKDKLIDIKDDGSYALNMEFFGYCTSLKMTSDSFNSIFDGEPRQPESIISQKEMDIAASIQAVTEEVVIKLAKGIAKSSGEENLCLAGGVALNCVANGKLVKSNIFKNIWIQPAAGDAGGSIGAAYAAHFSLLNQPRHDPNYIDGMKGSFLGPEFQHSETKEYLSSIEAVFTEHDEDELIDITARALSTGKAIGWMNGRMEFGPRSLGARSIIADPRSPSMQRILNLKVKYRESFRPFAPSVLAEDAGNWFELNTNSPYMLLVADVLKEKQIEMTLEEQLLFGIDKLNVPRSIIPAVTHVDYSARIQTVHKETNPRYHKLISKFKDLTGCPILVNTSFNVRGEPIVCSPKDAFRCFMGTELDILVIGNIYLQKEKQPKKLAEDYRYIMTLTKLNIKIKFLQLLTFASVLLIDYTYGANIQANFNQEKKYGVSHPTYHHTLAPSFNGYEIWGRVEYPICTNKYGFKNKCDAINQDDKSIDIAFIGDSFTEGVGLKYENTFVRQIASQKSGLKIKNLAVFSYAASIYLAKTKDLIKNGFKIKELVVYSDIQDEAKLHNYFNGRVNNKTSSKIHDFFLNHFPLTYASTNIITVSISNLLSIKSTPTYLDYGFERSAWKYNNLIKGYGDKGVEAAINKSISIMEELHQLLKKNDIKLSIGIYPWPGQLKYDSVNYRQVLIWEEFCKLRRAHFHNSFPIFFTLKNNLVRS